MLFSSAEASPAHAPGASAGWRRPISTSVIEEAVKRFVLCTVMSMFIPWPDVSMSREWVPVDSTAEGVTSEPF
jgi:hypothetical protein